MSDLECLVCGKPVASVLKWRVYCDPCRERVLLLQVAVARTMAQYEIPPANDFNCVDCGRQAKVYDHRYYSHPLEVDPVCAGCNNKRGPALDIVPCLVELANYGITSKYGFPAAPHREYPALTVRRMELDAGLPLQEAIDKAEAERIRSALTETNYNKTAAAKSLGITFRALRYRMERLSIQ
jgi:hypothetical protein